MSRLRGPACPTVSTGVAFRADVAGGGAAVILSAICAMKVPRPIMIAAKIKMLRITPHSMRSAISPLKPGHRDQDAPAEAAILAKRMSEGLTRGACLAP